MATSILQEAAMLVVREAAAAATASGTVTPNGRVREPESFFEKHKFMIIGAAIGIPLQIIGGIFYFRYRKAKKAAAAAEKANIEVRLKELEMGLGNGKQVDGTMMYEQQSVYAGPKF